MGKAISYRDESEKHSRLVIRRMSSSLSYAGDTFARTALRSGESRNAGLRLSKKVHNYEIPGAVGRSHANIFPEITQK